MSQIDLDTVLGVTETNDGSVLPITIGSQVCATVRENLRALIQASDPEGYAQYRAIKYPGGDGTDTPETRIEATRFIFDRARDLLVPHYIRIE